MGLDHDIGIVGAGLIGLATARALVESLPGRSIVVMDKADSVATHQSAHNSGVIHSGLYYRPGTLKADLCASGRTLMYDFCEERGIPHRRTGKLVIASNEREIPALDELARRATANGLTGIERLGPRGITEYEPEAVGLAALHVPDAGVVDYPTVASHIALELEASGVSILLDAGVTDIRHATDGVSVLAGENALKVAVLVNCAGLHSDRIALLSGLEPAVRIVPFRGEYYRLSDQAERLVQGLVYPVPDPRFPFLGVHFTRRIDGAVEVGPNAVLALGRENYRGTPVDWGDVRDTFAYRGFRRLATAHLASGVKELVNSRSRRMYARLARNLVPAVRTKDLLPGGSGVRAQAVTRDGKLVDDFVIQKTDATIQVLNAPSPGATASLAIGRHIAAQVETILRQ